jgi:PAS domain S-box-containing protein
MATELRKTGIEVVGDVPWGTHFCHFYETKEDLLDMLVPYFKAGLESQECCLWVVAEPLTEEEASHALRQAVPDLDRYLADGSIEILLGREWYLQGGTFDLARVTSGWNAKLAHALARDYAGIRVTGNTAWLEKKDWSDFCEYEDAVNASFTNQRMTVLCSYPLAASGAAEILDVARTHQFAIAKRHGNWEVIETSELKQAKEEIKRLNEELEQRVVERTRQLTTVNEELRKEITARKRAEESLRRSEAYLTEGQRLSHTGSWAWNVAAGENVFWSKEHFRIYGFDPAMATVPHHAARERIYADDLPLFDQAFDRAIRERADVDLTHRIVLPDGSMKYIHTLGHPVLDESGALVEYIGTVMDVTERQRAEEEREQLLARVQAALAEAEAAQHRFRDLVNSIEGIVWEADAGTFTFSFVSKQAERVLGYPVERWLSEPTFWKDHIHPDDREWAVNFCVTATAEKRDHDLEYRMIAADERIVWLRDLGTVVVEGDRATRLRGVMFDITERKRAEEALRKSERQFHALFDEAAIGMALVNAAGHLFESNRTLQLLLGYSAEELGDMPFTQLTHPDDVELDWHLFTELIRGERDDYHLEKRYYGKDGRLVWGNLTVSLVRDERGEPLFGIGVVEDITERKRAEEALRHTQAALAHVSRVMTMGALTASIAHEVNQPLAGVVTNGQACLRWLARAVPDLAEARAAVERIIRDGHRASEVIRRLRALTQKTEPQTAWLDLNDVIHEVSALVHSEVRKHRVALWTDLSPALPPVLGDRIQLQQVLLNLLINGIEALQAVTDRVRELQIRSYRHASDEVGVAVRDAGIGLDPENMARLFDAFFTTKPGGTGIGLAISRTIIEAHGGRLWATPHDGPGATFQFTLPAGSERVS